MDVRIYSLFYYHITEAPTSSCFTLSLHDALPILRQYANARIGRGSAFQNGTSSIARSVITDKDCQFEALCLANREHLIEQDRKSTRLNSVTCQSRMPSSA